MRFLEEWELEKEILGGRICVGKDKELGLCRVCLKDRIASIV